MEQTEEGVRLMIDAVHDASKRMYELRNSALSLGVDFPPLPNDPRQSLTEAFKTRSRIDLLEMRSFAQMSQQWLASAKEALASATPTSSEDPDMGAQTLSALVTRARAWKEAKDQDERTRRACTVASAVFDKYQGFQAEHMTRVLKRISAQTAAIYAQLHPGEGLAGC
jgi:hypothetical protein